MLKWLIYFHFPGDVEKVQMMLLYFLGLLHITFLDIS